MRKILSLLVILSLLLNSTSYALTPIYACTSGGTWSGSIWVLSTGAQAACTGGSAPVAGDEAILNSAAGNVTVAANTTTAGLDMTGYTGTLTVNSGDTLTISAGDPCILTSDIEGPGIILTNSGGVNLLSTITSSVIAQITLSTSQTWTSNGFIWPGNIYTAGNNTITMSGDFNISGGFINKSANLVYSPIFSGSYNLSFGNLFVETGSGSNASITFPAGKTVTINNSIQMIGNNQSNLSTAYSLTIKSSSTTPFLLNYSGTLANENIVGVIFTYVDASGSSVPIYNYNGSTLTGTTNITNVNASNFGGSSTASQGYIYGE